jgi:hypothetical protein
MKKRFFFWQEDTTIEAKQARGKKKKLCNTPTEGQSKKQPQGEQGRPS